MGVELGFSVTREEGGRGPGQGNQSREEGPGPEGPASREGRGFSSVGGAAEGLEQRVAAPGSVFLLRSLSSTRVLDTTGLCGPGSQAGLRPGCWPPTPGPGAAGMAPPLPGLAFAAFLTSIRGPCMGLITPGADNEAPPTAHEASFKRLMVTGEGTKGRCASPPL